MWPNKSNHCPLPRLQFAALLIALLSLVACRSSTDEDSPVILPPVVVIPQTNHCAPFDANVAVQNGGYVNDILDADWTLGSSLIITEFPRGDIASFEATTGEITYAPSVSRLPDRMVYELRDDLGSVVAKYQRYWIAQPLRIMPIGDSITAGVEYFDTEDYPAVPYRVGYRLALHHRLTQAEQRIDFIGQSGQSAGQSAGLTDPDNNGYPGVDIAFINSKIPDVLNGGPSDVMLLHIGTNNTPADASTVIDIVNKVENWSQNNHSVKVLVSTLIPKRDSTLQTQVNLFNTSLRQQIAQNISKNVYVVEQAIALGVEDLSNEAVGIHPNPAGYLKMADTWYEALKEFGIVQICD